MVLDAGDRVGAVWRARGFGRTAVQQRGLTDVPGLYFLGLPRMHTRGSALIGWVGRDAAYLAGVVAKRA